MHETPETGNSRYLFYMHGLIVEGTTGRPQSRDHGVYEYPEIVKALSAQGFTVVSEIRPANCDIKAYAQKVAAEVQTLLDEGVSEEQITVVGASKGGMIAATVSHMLKHPHIRYVILAGFFPSLARDGVQLHGEVLSIHDSSDQYTILPELFFKNSPELTRSKMIVTDTGLGHGLLYTPHPAWVNETVNWATAPSN